MELKKNPHPNSLLYPQLPKKEINFRELFWALWKGKLVIIATTIVFTVASVIYALSLPNIYKADALLAPSESSSGGGLSKMAGQLGGLAALAGVNLGGGESSQTELAVQVMKSRQFIDLFIEKHNLLVPLMATEGWELSTNELVVDNKVYDSENGEWLRKPQGLRGAKPSKQEAYELFSRELFNVSLNKETGLYTVSISHYSPYVAQQWVTWLIEDINKVMRERTISETSQNLAYLDTQLQKTAVTDMQSTFYKLIEEQTKSLMLAEVQEEFVFKVVDPAVVPEVKSGPKRALICVVGFLLGLLIGSLAVITYFTFKEEK
ncbi:Wzz/FepE/Etk N-terminal domain-containing protein [Vibrio parahaemolyticus]|uniref:Wzz/FepE/Etk N-terminal domain-containing protein n=1 Tax=Vibrio parahaemolyticus TaxID=670 RepID=UPI001E4BAF30|nr:Wzz/FepE/Etk N-terminal domain-containing protein [Vibrio parahaemolyticus]